MANVEELETEVTYWRAVSPEDEFEQTSSAMTVGRQIHGSGSW